MVSGVVNDQLEAIVDLSIMGPAGQTREIEAIVDTGFNGFLFLPTDVVTELGLVLIHQSPLILADGTVGRSEVFEVSVIWDNQALQVEALASFGTPLIGMAMLRGHRLTVDVEEGGEVLIESRI